MKVYFTQVYIEPGVTFPFSCEFQRRLAEEVSAVAEPSATFNNRYGNEFDLHFYISAKSALQVNEIRGPSVSRKNKDVEYTVFLPFDVISRRADAPQYALNCLLKGVCDVFDVLEIEKTKLLAKKDSIIDGICSDSTMRAEPFWDPVQNKTHIANVFRAFFEKNQRA